MKTVSRGELKAMIESDEDFELINVLSPDTFQKGHIPGSYNIPLTEGNFVGRVEQTVGGKDKTIVTYCASYDCPASREAANALEQAGFTEVYAFEGGMREWREAGFGVVGGPT
jgi:rhodanese-related sulfurtransferase